MLPDKAGFGNNFTTGDNKSVAQNMEAVVVGCMFKSLITRCASTTHELHSPENLVCVRPQPYYPLQDVTADLFMAHFVRSPTPPTPLMSFMNRK